MRVLWTHNFDPGILNSGVFFHNLVGHIRSRGVDLKLEYLGNLRSVPQILRARRRVRELARDFDLVHAQYGSACALVTAAARDVPRVVTIRGSDWQVLRSSGGFAGLHSRLATRFSKASIRRFDCVISVSHRISADVARYAPGTRLEVLPSSIDLSEFSPLDKREAKRRLGHPDNEENWILFNSGNLKNPVKRFDLARQAFDAAQARRGNLQLRLATGIPHQDMPLHVAACDLILCTSENEGWPNSVKEALACNVPFVATDVGDLKDIANIEPSCRVCPAEAGTLAENICEVLAGPAPQNLRKFVQDMSLDAVSDRVISIYRSLTSG